MSDDYILIVTDDVTESTDNPSGVVQRGWGDEVKKKISNVAKVPADLLEANMNRFLRFVGRVFKQVDHQIGSDSDMQLDEVELSLELTSKGEIKLVAGAEAKSAITLKFKRVHK